MLSDEILKQRLGTITASASHRMMAGWDDVKPTAEFPTPIYDWIEKNGRKPLVGDIKDVIGCTVSGKLIDAAMAAYKFDNVVPKGLITYAEELACDELFDKDPNAWDGQGSEHIENGNERELDGMIALSKATGLEFVKTGDDQVHLSIDGLGATADGLVYDDLDLIKTGAEIKCRSALHHARQLLINDDKTLMEEDFDRYCQIQVQMIASETEYWYSANYNPHAKREEHRLHYTVINRNDAFIGILRQRAQLVYKHKALFLDRLMKVSNPLKVAA